MGATDFAQSIVNQFLENWEHDFQKLEVGVAKSIDQNDSTDLIREAHRLKGTAATIGADKLAQQFLDIEVLTKSCDSSQDYEENIRTKLNQLQIEIDLISEFAVSNL